MPNRRKHRPKLSALNVQKPDSDVCCWFCGNTRNCSAKKYDGLCYSCHCEFQEDDIAIAVWEGAA